MSVSEQFAFVNDLRDRFLLCYAGLSEAALNFKLEGYKNSIGFLLRQVNMLLRLQGIEPSNM
ncbi:MAG: hypothetical protein M0Z55_10900 [Peptococcaceae bacterium]|nr:hypothetical protein [Peptococcaceae bacterium]